MTQLFQAQIGFVSIIDKMYLHYFCGCADYCDHVARAAIPSTPKKSTIPWDHTTTASYTLIPLSYTPSYPLTQQQASCPASDTEIAKKDFVHSQRQWSSPDDVTRMAHQAVTILHGHKAFLISRNSPVTIWLGAAQRDPWAKTASGIHMPHACLQCERRPASCVWTHIPAVPCWCNSCASRASINSCKASQDISTHMAPSCL